MKNQNCGIAVFALRQCFLSFTFCILIFDFPVVGSITTDPQGQTGDGSRAQAVHLIPLVAEPLPEEKEGQKITPKDELVLPFSTRKTCCECHISEHNYDLISKGWHFNAADPNVPRGRPGEPWIYVDVATATQIPLSYRLWPGTFKPDQLGVEPFEFTALFGRHTPGGGPGELDAREPDLIPRQIVSGKLEINCLSCHDADPAHNQAEYAGQVSNQSYRWAAAASVGFASVSGSAKQMPDTYDYAMPQTLDDPKKDLLRPNVTYRANVFDHKSQVFFDITREVPRQRCYFCHSNVNVDKQGLQKWTADEDVHLTAGLTCIDCHRNGLDHNMTRGYEGEAVVSSNQLAATSSCEGCHLGQKTSADLLAGRLGAPVPKHPGIPPVHFEKVTCTACHSGPWPGQETYRSKTSRAHALGTYNVNKSPDVLPHIVYPVFAKQGTLGTGYAGGAPVLRSDGKIAPHKLIWPAFWGTLKDQNVTPVAIETVREAVSKVLSGQKPSASGSWRAVRTDDIAKALAAIDKAVDGVQVYVGGGKLYRLDDGGALRIQDNHPAAKPYLWPIAHDVRPAAQSLGARSCQDCHATDAPFFFGKVAVDSPIISDRDSAKKMVEFQDIDPFYAWAFAFSFVFRPWLKVVALGCSAVLGIVLLLYGLKALASVAKVLAEQD